MANTVPYIREAGAGAIAHYSGRRADIVRALRDTGFWERSFEWRISTIMVTRIEIEADRERKWFKVMVHCGGEFSCRTPTLERALEFAGLFERLGMDIFWTLGWSTWAAKGRLDSEVGETRPW